MMKEKYINEVLEAFRKGRFKPVSGGDPVRADYDEAYLDERTDFDFDHMFIHLIKDDRTGDFIEVFSVDTGDEYLGSQYAPAKLFTEFYSKAMEAKYWHIRMKFDPERKFEISGVYEEYNTEYSIIAFYAVKYQ